MVVWAEVSDRFVFSVMSAFHICKDFCILKTISIKMDLRSDRISYSFAFFFAGYLLLLLYRACRCFQIREGQIARDGRRRRTLQSAVQRGSRGPLADVAAAPSALSMRSTARSKRSGEIASNDQLQVILLATLIVDNR